MIVVVILDTVCVVGLVFFTCEIGQRFSSKFNDISDAINEFKWYSFPLELQRVLPLIILDAQQPVAIKCFGSMMCERDTFKKVSIDQQMKLISWHAIDIDLDLCF